MIGEKGGKRGEKSVWLRRVGGSENGGVQDFFSPGLPFGVNKFSPILGITWGGGSGFEKLPIFSLPPIQHCFPFLFSFSPVLYV